MTDIAYLDGDARVELADEDDGLYVGMGGEGGWAMLELPRTADAWRVASAFAHRILALEPEIRRRTIGYVPPSSPPAAYVPEHNAHTGPGVRGPIERRRPI